MVQAGDFVRLKTLPPGFDCWQPGEGKEIFKYCLGRVYRVHEIDEWGFVVLDVSADIDPLFGGFMNDIRVEEECLEVVAGREDR